MKRGEGHERKAKNPADRHGRDDCLRGVRARPAAGPGSGTDAGLYSGAVRRIRDGRGSGLQHRQHQHDPGNLGRNCGGSGVQVSVLRRLCHLPRHRHHGLYQRGTVVHDPELQQANRRDRIAEAHQRGEHRCAAEPDRQHPLCGRSGLAGRDACLQRKCDCGNPREEDLCPQLQRLQQRELPGAGSNPGQEDHPLSSAAGLYRTGPLQLSSEREHRGAEADPRHQAGAGGIPVSEL